MNETRHSIGALCQHLNFLFGADLKPEHFRLAKFDKSDGKVVDVLWNLLGRFVCAKTSLSTVHLVKLYLYALKYESPHFFCLPEDMAYGSRELLLAFGFLLGRGALDDIVRKHLEKTAGFEDIDTKEINFDSPCDERKAVAWMRGKTQLNQRMINELAAQNEVLLAQVNERIAMANVSELSFDEVLALKRRRHGEEFLGRTEFAVHLLENHQRWIKKRQIFWRWMNSVLAERAKTRGEKTIELQHLKKFSDVIKNNSSSLLF